MHSTTLPLIVTNLLSIMLLIFTLGLPTIARVVLSTIFGLAGIINLYLGMNKPEVYLEFASVTRSVIYQSFITGSFAEHIKLFVITISFLQLAVSVLMAFNRTAGFLGGIIFLLAIAPLGIGSAFPSSIFMALSCAVLVWNKELKIA